MEKRRICAFSGKKFNRRAGKSRQLLGAKDEEGHARIYLKMEETGEKGEKTGADLGTREKFL